MQNAELLVITADNSMRAVIAALLQRHDALGVRDLRGRYSVRVHVNFDAATFRSAPETLRSQSKFFRYAVVLCDRLGSGSGMTREEMEAQLESRLARSGWHGRSAAVVIDPELESWIWQRSPHVAAAIGWQDGIDSLYRWLAQRGFETQHNGKPLSPKEALNQALYVARTRKSAYVFHHIATRVSLKGCTDPAFLKLQNLLRQWFPPARDLSAP